MFTDYEDSIISANISIGYDLNRQLFIIGLDEKKVLIYYKNMNLRYISRNNDEKKEAKDARKSNELKKFAKNEFSILAKRNLNVSIYLVNL